jgi:hypothetical protein
MCIFIAKTYGNTNTNGNFLGYVITSFLQYCNISTSGKLYKLSLIPE